MLSVVLLWCLCQSSELFISLFCVDTDPRVLEKQELQQPTYVALSYINRYTSQETFRFYGVINYDFKFCRIMYKCFYWLYRERERERERECDLVPQYVCECIIYLFISCIKIFVFSTAFTQKSKIFDNRNFTFRPSLISGESRCPFWQMSSWITVCLVLFALLSIM